jgi:hypothetical protein
MRFANNCMRLCSDCFFAESAFNKDETLLFIVFSRKTLKVLAPLFESIFEKCPSVSR